MTVLPGKMVKLFDPLFNLHLFVRSHLRYCEEAQVSQQSGQETPSQHPIAERTGSRVLSPSRRKAVRSQEDAGLAAPRALMHMQKAGVFQK